jgi:hypothetical protein
MHEIAEHVMILRGMRATLTQNKFDDLLSTLSLSGVACSSLQVPPPIEPSLLNSGDVCRNTQLEARMTPQ